MPVQRCYENGKQGWRWGRTGKCYTGPNAKQKAYIQGYAVRKSGYTENALRPLRRDPTRTLTLRRRFERDLTRRYRRLKGKINDLVIEEDAFGLKQRPLKIQSAGTNGASVLTAHQRFRFATRAQQIEAFEQWMRQQTDEILRTEEYWKQYTDAGYRKGAGRAFDDTHRVTEWTGEEGAFYQGSKEEFLRSSFAHPQSIEKTKLLASRTFADLKGANEAMTVGVRRALVDGFVRGDNPRKIGRDLNRVVDSIGKRRAQTIARTEVIRAHAEGQLDAMERLGVTQVGVMVEWSAAWDERTCPLCVEMDGVVLKVREARGMIPRHPNCRCAFTPANVGETERLSPQRFAETQKRSKAEIEASIRRSLKAAKPKKRTLSEQLERSTWTGADRVGRISKARPKPPVKPGRRA